MEESNILTFEEHKKASSSSFVSKLFCVLIAFVPILMPYRFFSYSMASIVAVLLAIIAILFIIYGAKSIRLGLISFFLVFLLYAIFKSSGARAIVLIVVFIILIGLTTGFVEASFFRKTIEIFAAVASIAVILQTFWYYTFGTHIPLIIKDFCTEETIQRYSSLIQTGINSNFYRPSAFFLEPSHFTQFCIVALSSSLLRKKPNIRIAVLISIGMLATTSGMGIIMILIAWLYWLFIYNFVSFKNHFLKYAAILLVGIVIVLMLYRVPFIQQAASRVLQGNAINGRWFWWESYFGQLKVNDLLYGFGTSSLPSEYFTGFMSYLWSYGIIGFSLFSIGCVRMFFGSKRISKYLILLFYGLMFFANATSVVGLVFNYGAIVILCKEL